MSESGAIENKFQSYENLMAKAAACLNAGMLTEGMDACRAALEMAPERCEGYFALAVAAYLIDDLGRAIQMAEEGHEIAPECREGCDLLAHLHAHTGNINDSVYFAKLAAAGESYELLTPIIVKGLDDLADAINNPGKTSYMTEAMRSLNREQYSDAISACEKEMRLRKNDPAMFRAFGRALMGAGKIGQSISAFQAAVHYEPEHAGTLLRLGSAYYFASEPHLAMACHQAAIEATDDVGATLAEISHMYAGYFTNPWPELERASDEWLKSQRASMASGESRGSSADRDMIHLGFLFDRVCESDELRYIEPLLLNIDRTRFSISVYAKEIPDDSMPRRLSSLSEHWVNIANSTDQVVVDTIRRYAVDILVDATSTPTGHRPGVVAGRPASHMLNWLAPDRGLFSKLYDGSLSDLGEAASVIALDPAKLPDVKGDSPVKTRGNVVFSATCDFSRISPDVVRTWSRVLRSVPDSKLILGNTDVIPDDVVRRAHELFSAFGAVDRIEFAELAPNDKSDRFIKQMEFLIASDVYLDTFPMEGQVDVAYALWCGLPVIVMEGGDSRGHAAGIARAAGMDDWIAANRKEYVEKAVSAASAVSETENWRTEAHKRVKASRLFQPQQWGNGLSDALFELIKNEN